MPPNSFPGLSSLYKEVYEPDFKAVEKQHKKDVKYFVTKEVQEKALMNEVREYLLNNTHPLMFGYGPEMLKKCYVKFLRNLLKVV